MVDVFKRWDFTSDTNAMLVGFFQEFADAEESAGNATGAETLRKLSDDVKGDLRKYLWDAEDNDHFITQVRERWCEERSAAQQIWRQV